MRRVPTIRTDDVSPVSVLKRSASGVGGHTLRWPPDWTGEAKSIVQKSARKGAFARGRNLQLFEQTSAICPGVFVTDGHRHYGFAYQTSFFIGVSPFGLVEKRYE